MSKILFRRLNKDPALVKKLVDEAERSVEKYQRERSRMKCETCGRRNTVEGDFLVSWWADDEDLWYCPTHQPPPSPQMRLWRQ